MRKDFSRTTKREALRRCNGHCEKCNKSLINRIVEFHHANGDNSDNSLENCSPLCYRCHLKETTEVTIPTNAKIKRIHDRHIGIRKRSRFPYSRSSPFKKKVSGEVVKR